MLVSSNFDGVAYGLDKRVVDAAGTDAKIIVKERDDAFDGTGLKKLLHGMRVDTLILCGYNSACCVLKTAKSAFGEFSIITSPKAMYYPPWGEVRKFYETYTMHLQLEDVVRLLQGNKEKPDSE